MTNYDKAVKELSVELGLTEKQIEKTYRGYWKNIKKLIQELPLDKDLTEEEFNKLNVNFNIPSLGKLNCTYKRYTGLKKRQHYNDKDKEN